MNTFILRVPDGSGWQLIIARDGKRVWSRVFPKLVLALDAANTLGIHVDNTEHLPLSQYLLETV